MLIIFSIPSIMSVFKHPSQNELPLFNLKADACQARKQAHQITSRLWFCLSGQGTEHGLFQLEEVYRQLNINFVNMLHQICLGKVTLMVVDFL